LGVGSKGRRRGEVEKRRGGEEERCLIVGGEPDSNIGARQKIKGKRQKRFQN